MKKINLTILAFVFCYIAKAQSTLISPESQQGGIYSKRAMFLNPFETLPTYSLPDSGKGTRLMWIPERSAFRAGTAFDTEWNNAKIGGFSFASGVDLLANGLASVAFGYQNIASGHQSFVAGYNNQVLAQQSFSFGLNNKSKGAGSGTFGNNNTTETGSGASFAIGQNNSVKNGLSIAIGLNNAASASNSFVFGIDNSASGQKSIAIGNGSSAGSFSSVALGTSVKTLGQNALALGYFTQAEGVVSTAAGSGSVVRGNYGFTLGRALISNIKDCFVVGSFNDSVSTNPNSYNSDLVADPIFMVGNGTTSQGRTNALTLFKNGRLGIGTTAPSQLLDVNGSARFRSVGTSTASFGLGITSNGTLTKISLGTPSDFRLKTHIEPIHKALEKTLLLNGYYFEYKSELGRRRLGFIAQEVESVIPEAVMTDSETSLKSMNYPELVALLVEAIKTQQAQISALQGRIEQIEKPR